MRSRLTLHMTVLALLLLTAGCASGRRLGDPFQESNTAKSVRIHITNLNFMQATVYGVTTGSRMKLGVVEGKRETVLTMPLQHTTELHLEIDLLAGPTCYTDRLVADPGDEFDLTIQQAGGNMTCRARR